MCKKIICNLNFSVGVSVKLRRMLNKMLKKSIDKKNNKNSVIRKRLIFHLPLIRFNFTPLTNAVIELLTSCLCLPQITNT